MLLTSFCHKTFTWKPVALRSCNRHFRSQIEEEQMIKLGDCKSIRIHDCHSVKVFQAKGVELLICMLVS